MPIIPQTTHSSQAAFTAGGAPEAAMFYELSEAEAAIVRALARHGTCEAAADELDRPADDVRRELADIRQRLVEQRRAQAA